MKITEILDTRVNFKIVDRGDTFNTTAIIGDRRIIFTARKGWNSWDINFIEAKEDGKTSTAVTGSGDEFAVFSMIKDSVLEFIKRHSPDEFVFDAYGADKDEAENSDSLPVKRNVRADLYERFIKRLKIPGYEYVRNQKPNSTADVFVFKKIVD